MHIIGKIEQGCLTLNHKAPFVHDDVVDASGQAGNLAAAEPGTVYVVLSAVSAVLTEPDAGQKFLAADEVVKRLTRYPSVKGEPRYPKKDKKKRPRMVFRIKGGLVFFEGEELEYKAFGGTPGGKHDVWWKGVVRERLEGEHAGKHVTPLEPTAGVPFSPLDVAVRKIQQQKPADAATPALDIKKTIDKARPKRPAEQAVASP